MFYRKKTVKKNLHNKLLILIITVFVFIFPTQETMALSSLQGQENIIQLSTRETNLILHSLIQQITDKWIDMFFAPAFNPEKEAALIVLRSGIQSNSFDYLIFQAPKEILIDLIKYGTKIAPLASSLTASDILKMSLDKIKKELIEWLIRNELKTGGGNIALSYKTYSGKNETIILPYTMVYNPKNNKIEINIYSSKIIEAPQPTLKNKWLGGIERINPFVANISGEIIKNQYGGYSWPKQPSIEINFPSSVPDFEFKNLYFLGSEISELNKTLIAIKKSLEIINNVQSFITSAASNARESIKSGLSWLSNMGSASLNSFLGLFSDKSTVISLSETNRSSLQYDLEKELITESNKEVEKLKTRIIELEKQILESNRELSGQIIALETKTTEKEKININTASKKDLIKIIHIGPTRAEEIIRLRPFSSLDDLIRVSGIGEKIIIDIKNQGMAYVDELVIKQETIKEKVEEKDKEKKEEVDQEKIKESEEEKEGFCQDGININTASLEELSFFPGIGPVIAQRIINARPFSSLDDLLRVSGIGPIILQNIKDQGCAYAKNGSSSFPSSSSSPTPSSPKEENDKNIDKDDKEKCLLNSIEVNTADGKELEKIINIGPARAEQIIVSRTESPFSSLDDLLRVSGIGPIILQNIKDQGCAYVDQNLLPPTEENGENDDSDDADEEETHSEIKIVNAETVWNVGLILISEYVAQTSEIKRLSSSFVFSADDYKDFEDLLPIPKNNNLLSYNLTITYDEKNIFFGNNNFYSYVHRRYLS